MSRRLGLADNMLIMAGFVIVISSLLVGGTIGQSFPPKMAFPIILFAALSNSFVSVLIGAIGARTGYTSGLIYRFSYGRIGTLLPNFVMAFTAAGWFSIIIGSTRDLIAEHFGVAAGNFMYFGIMIIVSLMFVIPAFVSIKWIGYVNYIAVPALVIIIGYLIVKSFQIAGGISGLMAIDFEPKMPILMGLSAAAGGWLQGATVSPDFTRYAKDGKQSAWTMLASFGFLAFVQFAAGAMGAATTGEWNIFLILTASGAGFIAVLAVFLGAWSTCQAQVYGASLQATAPPSPMVKNQEFTRRMWVVILWVFALIVGYFGLGDSLSWYLGILAAAISPTAITTILDYYAFPERQAMYESNAMPDKDINPAAIVSWIVGFAVVYFSNERQILVPVLNGMVVSGIIYYVWMRLELNKKKPNIQ